jgi:hypothetical protein
MRSTSLVFDQLGDASSWFDEALSVDLGLAVLRKRHPSLLDQPLQCRTLPVLRQPRYGPTSLGDDYVLASASPCDPSAEIVSKLPHTDFHGSSNVALFEYSTVHIGKRNVNLLRFPGRRIWLGSLRAELAELRSRGITVEECDLPGLKTEDGIADIGFAWMAWIVDPGKNAVAIMQIKV